MYYNEILTGDRIRELRKQKRRTVPDTDVNTLLGVSGKEDTGRNVLQERLDVPEGKMSLMRCLLMSF